MRSISAILLVALSCTLVLAFAPFTASSSSDAPAAFDNKSNGMVDDATHQADQNTFEEVEQISDGLGPLYNAQSCRECHQNPVSGGPSQVNELRVGHVGRNGKFENPSIPIADGKEVITGRTLVNDRAICPNGAFPDTEIQERVPDSEKVRTFRVSLNLLGDGFVESVTDQALMDLAKEQCRQSHGAICGLALRVPVLEAPGETSIGRFGWKDQHASLLSFSADAYLNEMGITSRLQPDEVTNLCNTVAEPNDKVGPDGLSDIDKFARFLRSTKTPPPDQTLAATDKAKHGSDLFDKIGCNDCHVRSMTTAPAGTKVDGGAFTVPEALGSKQFHAYSDFLLHNVGTGDGIVIPVPEHYGRRFAEYHWKEMGPDNFQPTQYRIRTAPLWGLRMRTRLMHDGASLTARDAIVRHSKEGSKAAKRFKHLSAADQTALLEFLQSL
jgi:CxxC motif-containing protein (DUF1111 family)